MNPFTVTTLVTPEDNGSTWWRQIEPFLLASANGLTCHVAAYGQPLVHAPHVLIFRGLFFEQSYWDKLIERCTEDKVMIVVDYDDCYHRMYEDVGAPEFRGTLNADLVRSHCVGNARSAHLITTTTPTLAAEIERVTGRDDVSVIPNAINLTSWQYLRPADVAHPVLMVMGGASHEDDWDFLPDLFGRLAPVFPSLRFRVAGTFPAKWTNELRGWLGDRLELVDWRRHEEYPRVYEGATVCIAPLRDTIFNRCRTPIKFWEATASGAGFVGSSALYATDVQSGVNGLLADTVSEYAECISDLLSHPDKRERMVSLARQTVRDHILDQEAIEARWSVYWNRYHTLYTAEADHGASTEQRLSQAAARFTERLWTPESARGSDDERSRHGSLLSGGVRKDVGERRPRELGAAKPNGHGLRVNTNKQRS